MILFRLLLLSTILLSPPLVSGAPEQPASPYSLPVIDQLRSNLSQSKLGFDLTLQNASYYAGWIPRGFITAILNIRPGMLPGPLLDRQQWMGSPWYREGLSYRPGITEWGARYVAERSDHRRALEAANQDYSGTAEIGFGRFLGSAADPLIIVLIVLVFSWLIKRIKLRGQRRRELTAMAAAHRTSGSYPPAVAAPAPSPDTATVEVLDEMAGTPLVEAAESESPLPDKAHPVPAKLPEVDSAQQPSVTEPPNPSSAKTPDPTADRAPEPTSTNIPEPTPEETPEPAAAKPPEPTAAASTEPVSAKSSEPRLDKPPAPRTTNTGSAEDLFTAFQTCRAWAEKGSTEDQFHLAVLFHHGTGVNPSPEQASHWFQKAAEGGHAQAQYQLAQRLFHGIGMLPDEHAAVLWLQQAAQQGLIDAKFNLVPLYARGLGTSPDAENALHWLEQAADDQDADAEDLLATAYQQGWLGLEKDPAKAESWRHRSLADRG